MGLPALTFEPDQLEIAAAAARRAHELGDPVLAADAESALRKLSHDLPLETSAPDDPHITRRDRNDAPTFELLNAARMPSFRVCRLAAVGPNTSLRRPRDSAWSSA